MSTTTEKKITIEPVSRVEGHGKVTLILDEERKVDEARFHIVEFRGFERFVQGRLFWELPVLVQRLCGICPVSHHLCASKAVDKIVGLDQITPTGEKMRCLMHYGQMFQSHALHFFHLSSPDLLYGFEAPREQRTITHVIEAHPELAVQGVAMRRWGQEIIKATAGKKVHGTGAVPGGINKSLSLSERDALKCELDKMLEWAEAAVRLARQYTLDHLEELAEFGTMKSNHLSIVGDDGRMELYDGKYRAIDPNGRVLIDGVPPEDYLKIFREEVRPWSYMKFPFLIDAGPEDGWFRVGPLSRLNTCTYIDTPRAENARVDFHEKLGEVAQATMAYHWARMIELLHAAEKIRELLDDPDLQGEDRVAAWGTRREEAVAVIEAPRGTLLHHYKVNENDQVVMANLIVSTTNNNEAMNRTVQRIAESHLSGKPEITEPMLNNIEVGIRAYDPCLSCATHALGQMPLEVTIVDHQGEIVDRKLR